MPCFNEAHPWKVVLPVRILLFGTLLKPTVGTDAENTSSLAEAHAHLREHPSFPDLSLEQELPLDHVVWIMFDSCLFLRSPWTVSSMRTASMPVCSAIPSAWAGSVRPSCIYTADTDASRSIYASKPQTLGWKRIGWKKKAGPSWGSRVKMGGRESEEVRKKRG